MFSAFNFKCYVLCIIFCCLTQGSHTNLDNVTSQPDTVSTQLPGSHLIQAFKEAVAQNADNLLTAYYNDSKINTRTGFGLLTSNGNISILPTNLFHDLKNLEFIDLDRSYIQDIESVPFKNLPSLKEISMSGNEIKKITADVFSEVPSVVKIILAQNQIEHIDSDAFEKTVNLTVLDLKGNQLEIFDVKWLQNTPKLQSLDISYNRLKHLPANPFSLKYFHQIPNFDFSWNEIETIDEDFMPNVPIFGKLNLNNNKLKVIKTDTFKHQRLIMNADFSDNQITEVRGFIPGFIVSFSRNNITCLSTLMHQLMESEGTIFLDGNYDYKSDGCF